MNDKKAAKTAMATTANTIKTTTAQVNFVFVYNIHWLP